MSCNPFGLLWASLVWPDLFCSLLLPTAPSRSLLLLALAASELTEKLIKAKGAACDSVASESSEVLSDGLFDSYKTLHHPLPPSIEYPQYIDVCVFNLSIINLKSISISQPCPQMPHLIFMHDNITEIFVKKNYCIPPTPLPPYRDGFVPCFGRSGFH